MISQEQSSLNSQDYPDLLSPSEEVPQLEQERVGSEVKESLDSLGIDTLIEKIQEGIDSGEQVEEVVTQGKEKLKSLRHMMRQLDKAQELGSQAVELAYQEVEEQYKEVLGKTAEAQSAQDLRDALSDKEGNLFEKIVTYHARQGDVEETKQDYAEKLTDTTQEETPEENQEQQEKGWFGKMTERVKEKGGKLWNKAREFWNKDTDDKGNKLTWYQKAGRKMVIGGGVGVAAGLLGATGIAGAGSVAAGLTGGLKLGITAIAAQTGYEKALNKIRQGDEQKLVSQVHEAYQNPETYQDLGKTQEMLHNLQVLAGLTGDKKYLEQMKDVQEAVSQKWGEHTVAQEQQKNETSEDQENQEDQGESEFQSLSVKDIHKALDRREYQQSLNQDKKQKERQQKTKAFVTGAMVGAGTHFLFGQIGGEAVEAIGDGANAVSETVTDQTVGENLSDAGNSAKEFAFGSEVHAAEIGKPGEFVRVDVNGDGEYQVLFNEADFELVKEGKLDPGEELGPNQTAVYSPETGEVEIGTLHPEDPYPGYEMVYGRLVPEDEVTNDTQGGEETQQEVTEKIPEELDTSEPSNPRSEQTQEVDSTPQNEEIPGQNFDSQSTGEGIQQTSEADVDKESNPESNFEPESDTQEEADANENVEEDSNPESHEEIPDVSADGETKYWIEESSRTGKSFDEMGEWEIIKAGGIKTVGEDGEIQWSLRQPEVYLDIENQGLDTLPEGHVAVWNPEMQEVDSLLVAETHIDLLKTPLDPDTVPWGEPETVETDQIPKESQSTSEADLDGEAHPESNSEPESGTQEDPEVEVPEDVEQDSNSESPEELPDVSADGETKYWIERSSSTEKPFDEMSEREIIEAGGIKTVGEEGDIQWRLMQSDSIWESQEHTPDYVPDGEVVIWDPETGELEVEPVAESHRYLLENPLNPDTVPWGEPEPNPEPESDTQEKDGAQESSEQNTKSVEPEPEPPEELEANIVGETYQLNSGDTLWSVFDQSLENLDIEGLSDGERFVLLQEFMMDASEGGGKEQIYQLLQNSQAGEQFLERIDVDSLDEWMKQDDPAVVIESSRYLGTGGLHGIDEFITDHI